MKTGIVLLAAIVIIAVFTWAAYPRMFVVACADANAVSVEFHSNMNILLVGQSMVQSQTDPNQLIITTTLQITDGSRSSQLPGG